MKKERIIMISSVVVVIILFFIILNVTSPSNKNDNTDLTSSTIPSPTDQTTAEDFSEFKIEDITQGTGADVKDGDTVSVNYLGTLIDGTKFDSSYDRETPFEFTVGAGQVIEGWDKGLVGMKVGGKRKLSIPSSMGYGASGAGSIPPNAGLIFEIELLEIKAS